MPHIHELYDFVVSVFIVRRGKVLLVDHRRYDEWLPIGGHVELDEDPEEALYREIREECGLKVRLLTSAPAIRHPGVKPLPTPSYMDAHRISASHRHVAFIYFAAAASARVKLHTREHREFRWFSREDLNDSSFRLTRSIRFYCLEALKKAAYEKK
jgi:8-oxo-dGTP pyrophosphatase MutT (NUDIX family)